MKKMKFYKLISTLLFIFISKNYFAVTLPDTTGTTYINYNGQSTALSTLVSAYNHSNGNVYTVKSGTLSSLGRVLDCNGRNDIGPGGSASNATQCLVNCISAKGTSCRGVSYDTTTRSCNYKGSGVESCNMDYNNGYQTYAIIKVDTPPAPPQPACTGSDCEKEQLGPDFSANSYDAIYPRTNRSSPTRTNSNIKVLKSDDTETTISGRTDPSDAILAQTSYLARVMIQANDVFPPSHLSSRTSGETYSSSNEILKNNIFTLQNSAAQRNQTGSAGGNSGSKDDAGGAWITYHLENYCDIVAQTSGINNCGNKRAAGVAVGADMKAESLLQSNIVPDPTKAPADEKANNRVLPAEAAMRFVYNITNTLPDTFAPDAKNYKLDPAEMIKNGKVTQEAAMSYINFLSRQSQVSLAQYVLMDILANRLQMDNIKIPVTKYFEDGNKNVEYKNTSRFGLLEFEATKRFSDPAWYDRVQQMPQPALLKEQLYMQALQLVIEFEKLKQQQYQTALFSSLTAMSSSAAKTLGDSEAATAEQKEASKAARDALEKNSNGVDPNSVFNN